VPPFLCLAIFVHRRRQPTFPLSLALEIRRGVKIKKKGE
jgi:hypothetical protein